MEQDEQVVQNILDRNKLNEIKDKVSKGLYIGRLPEKVKLAFMNWCKEEFAGDYGVGLCYLYHFKEGLLSSPNEILAMQIEELRMEIDSLKARIENMVVQPEAEPKIKTVSGKTLRKG